MSLDDASKNAKDDADSGIAYILDRNDDTWIACFENAYIDGRITPQVLAFLKSANTYSTTYPSGEINSLG